MTSCTAPVIVRRARPSPCPAAREPRSTLPLEMTPPVESFVLVGASGGGGMRADPHLDVTRLDDPDQRRSENANRVVGTENVTRLDCAGPRSTRA